MGLFSKDSAPQPGAPNMSEVPSTLAPLSKDRIKACLERESWSYSVDSDGDVSGTWEYGYFYFFTVGKQQEILHIRGTWRGQLTEQDMPRVLELCQAWNLGKLWPKVYPRLDDGILRVHTEHNVDYEHGLTDEQLRQHLVCAIETSMSFFKSLNEAFPEVWAEYAPKG